MIKILHAYGMPERLVHAIETMYQNTKAQVLTPDGETEQFEITAGVMQGDTLAPFLFIIVLDYALRGAIDGCEEQLGFTISPKRSKRQSAVTLTDLDFADDIALLSDKIEQAQIILSRVQRECQKVGLALNAKKTKYITYNIDTEGSTLKTNDGTELEKVEDFKYLGSWVDSTDKDIKIRKAQAWQALNKMNCMWNSNMKKEIKVRFFVAAIESILLYGCASWTVTPKIECMLNGTYTKMLRKATNVKWWECRTNAEVYEGLPLLGNKIAARRMKFAGHCHRHPELIASDLVLWQPNQKLRRRGRPKVDFVEVLRKDAGNLTTTELRTVMEDRTL